MSSGRGRRSLYDFYQGELVIAQPPLAWAVFMYYCPMCGYVTCIPFAIVFSHLRIKLIRIALAVTIHRIPALLSKPTWYLPQSRTS